MNSKLIAYWFCTILLCLAMGTGGLFNLLQGEEALHTMADLGLPSYMLLIVGSAKVLGAIALLLPKPLLLREWAYAGLTFDLLGASACHAFSRHPLEETITPLIVLGILIASYLLRPSHMKLTPPNKSDSNASKPFVKDS